MSEIELKKIENEFILKGELIQANFDLNVINTNINLANKMLLLQPIIFVGSGLVSLLLSGNFLSFLTISVPFCCTTFFGISKLKYSLQSKKQKREILRIEAEIFDNEQMIAESKENNLIMSNVETLQNNSTKNRIAPKKEYNDNKDNKLVRRLIKKQNNLLK